jgi:hypothetical protein
MLERLVKGRLVIENLRLSDLSLKLYDRITLIVMERGWKSTLPVIKAIRLAVMRYIGGNPVSPDEVKGIKLTKDGIPSILRGFIPLLCSENLEAIQAILSVLQIDHLSNWWPAPDLSTIENYSQVDINRGSFTN